jgi:ketosteroid isomerase-like protein
MSKRYGLQELADRAEIEDVITRYANALDSRDYDAVESCFTTDARAVYGGVELPRGAAAIITFLRQLRQGTSERHAGTHLASNILISLHGDQATADSYVIAYSVPPDQDTASPLKMRGIRYSDRLVRTGDEWRIAERIHRADWEGAVPNAAVTPIPAVGR